MKYLILLLLLIIPTFSLMFSKGIWTMHDFHLFRQFEFDLCIKEFVFPCRWARDSSLGFGQPMFVFYGQFPYIMGQIFRFLGFQIIDSVKATFILSLALSSVSMYILSSHLWGKRGGLLSALFYTYAPYRAVDAWVRGALPESLAFIFFPLIIYFLEKKSYLLLSISLALLLITHNLSFFMFTPFLGIWWLVRSRNIKVIPAGILALLLSAFYWLPVVVEASWTKLTVTTQDYYNFAHHFTSLYQLFLSQLWGFGGSVWGPNDTMSFSTGIIHWSAALMVLPVIFIKKLPRPMLMLAALVLGLGLVALFLTHGKSEIIWKLVPGLPYVQFPWRFLTMSTLFLSLSLGALGKVLSKFGLIALALFAMVFYHSVFKPDIWRPISDTEAFSGPLWREQISSAISDYWPATASSLPSEPAPTLPISSLGWSDLTAHARIFGTHRRVYDISVSSPYAKILFPVVYYPGWTALVDDVIHPVFPSGSLGLVTARIPGGSHRVELLFRDTFDRTLGNIISSLSLLGLISWIIFRPRRA